jgi:Crp-like helix-turn-helix domain
MVRCPIDFLRSEFEHSEHVRNLFVSYSETLLSQVQQTVACNALHSTEERMCRWLLMMHDRAGGEALPYTHEFLSHMLGANRRPVTLAAQSLQSAGLISYQRGKNPRRRPRRPRTRLVQVLRHRQGAVRCIPDAAINRGTERYNRTARKIIAARLARNGCTRGPPAQFNVWFPADRPGRCSPGQLQEIRLQSRLRASLANCDRSDARR